MKTLKSLFCIIIVITLLVAMVGFGNHSLAFWKLIKKDYVSPYLYMYEDFSDISWTVSPYYNTGTDQDTDDSGIVVIPHGGTVSSDNEYLTVSLDEMQSNSYPAVRIPFDKINAKENFDFKKLSYFVVTFDVWSQTVSPKLDLFCYLMDAAGDRVYPSNGACALRYDNRYVVGAASVASENTLEKTELIMSSKVSKPDTICCVLAIDPTDISLSSIAYFVNDKNNKLVYSQYLNYNCEYVSHFEISMIKPKSSCSLSIDNFCVYAFDRDFNGSIDDVLKEVNFR